MYHMRADPGEDGGVSWTFERKQVYSRTHHLLSVALLGKVKKDVKEEEIYEILKKVICKQGERCRHWTWRGVTVRLLSAS